MPLIVSILVAASLSFPPSRAGRESMFTFHEPALDYPYNIVSGRILMHKGKKYLCGRAKLTDGRPGDRRYVIFMEGDWQIWEPMMDNETWEGFNKSFEEICESFEEE